MPNIFVTYLIDYFVLRSMNKWFVNSPLTDYDSHIDKNNNRNIDREGEHLEFYFIELIRKFGKSYLKH